MNHLRQLGTARFSVLVPCAALFALAAGCSSDGAKSGMGPSGGSSGTTGVAGAANTAGNASVAGAANSAGNAGIAGAANSAGNASVAGAANSAGNASVAGAANSAGSGGASEGGGGASGGDTSGGAGGMQPVFPNCTPLTIPVTDTLITDFSVQGNSFGNYTNNLSSTIYTFASQVVGDTSGGEWHITGTVDDYSAVVFGLICKYDLSAFTGIQFDIKGTFSPAVPSGAGGSGGASGAAGSAGASGAAGSGGASDPGGAGGSGGAGGASSYGGTTTPQVTFRVATAPDDVDTAHASTTTWGTCVPQSGNQYDGSCATPSKVIPLTAQVVTQTVKWADLSGGKPRVNPDPTQITQIAWGLPWNGRGPAYNIDITIDNVMFTTN